MVIYFGEIVWGENIEYFHCFYTASYSNHYRHHFNKFECWHRRRTICFAVYSLFVQWMLFGTRYKMFFNREMREEDSTFALCFHFSFFYIVIQTNKLYRKSFISIFFLFGSLQQQMMYFFCLFLVILLQLSIVNKCFKKKKGSLFVKNGEG